MLIDLTCPAEIFRTEMPTEEMPAAQLTLFNLSDRVIVSVEATLKLTGKNREEREKVVYRARALNGRPHSTFQTAPPKPKHPSKRYGSLIMPYGAGIREQPLTTSPTNCPSAGG